MASLKEMKSIQGMVKKILIQTPLARDNDHKLIVMCHVQQDPALKELSYKDYAIRFINKKYASAESIMRVRRKLQEKHPELRGLKYEERHKEENTIRTNIKNL